MYKVNLVNYNCFSKVQQIVNALVNDIEAGTLKEEFKLPSINQFSQHNSVARDTVEKAYKQLRRRGYIASYPGKGYFVLDHPRKRKKVLIVFNKFSLFNKNFYDNVFESLGEIAQVDLKIYRSNIGILKEIVEDSLGKYDYYLLMSQSACCGDEKEYLEVIKKIPAHKLILLDRKLPTFDYPYRAVYQDFDEEIYTALCSSKFIIDKYTSFTLVGSDSGNYFLQVTSGVNTFCGQKNLAFHVTGNIGDSPLKAQSVYIVPDEENLVKLLKKIKDFGLTLGKDIGVISLNDTAFTELLDITVITANFQQMGQTVARLILGAECTRYKNPCAIIYRGSL